MADAIAAAWPLLAIMALVCGTRVRSCRRRLALNRAAHELRRPLQALALAPGVSNRGRRDGAAPDPLDLALAALEDLDAAINGSRPTLARRPVAARPLVEGALDRWRGVAATRERALAFEWDAGEAIVMADPARLTQALDNLLANAIEHGALRIVTRCRRSPVGLSISITTAAGPGGRQRSDPRRGHGLAVVGRVAAAHLGRFSMHDSGREVSAVLELPLAPNPLPAVPIEWAPRAA
jgi:signal transduction histidine kinase